GHAPILPRQPSRVCVESVTRRACSVRRKRGQVARFGGLAAKSDLTVRLVEARGGLVGEEYLRPRCERPRDRDANLLAGREATDPLLGPLREPDGGERLDRERG